MKTTQLIIKPFMYLLILLTFLLVGCETDIKTTKNYKVGYADGYQSGLNEGNDFKRGYQAGREAGIKEVGPRIQNAAYDNGYRNGYDDGFDAARPGTSGRVTGIWRLLIIIASWLGMLKILGSLLYFTWVVMFESKNSYETWAKFLVSTLSVVVLFWLSHSLTIGFSITLEEFFLTSGVESMLGKMALGIVGAAGMYVFLYTLEILVQRTKGYRNLQALCVFVSSFATLVLIPFFFSLNKVPNLQAYIFFDVILGIIIGGVFFIVRTVFKIGDRQS